MPINQERATVFRAALIDPSAAACEVFVYDERDYTGTIDFADAGNIESTLPPCRRPLQPNIVSADIADLPANVDQVEQSDGSVSLRINGLEFGRSAGGRLFCGIGKKRPCSVKTLTAMAEEIGRLRNDAAEDRQHPLYSQYPEGWLESQVRANPRAIDASLRPAPIYGQVPVFSGPERGLIDLLGIDDTGRLVVIELKTTADLQLPFQALDYWLRVRKHLAAGDFEKLGLLLRVDDPPRCAPHLAGRAFARISFDDGDNHQCNCADDRFHARRSRGQLAQRTARHVQAARRGTAVTTGTTAEQTPPDSSAN